MQEDGEFRLSRAAGVASCESGRFFAQLAARSRGKLECRTRSDEESKLTKVLLPFANANVRVSSRLILSIGLQGFRSKDAWYTTNVSQQHVNFVGTDNPIYELVYKDNWSANDLTMSYQ
jgi:hypothetical protein